MENRITSIVELNRFVNATVKPSWKLRLIPRNSHDSGLPASLQVYGYCDSHLVKHTYTYQSSIEVHIEDASESVGDSNGVYQVLDVTRGVWSAVLKSLDWDNVTLGKLWPLLINAGAVVNGDEDATQVGKCATQVGEWDAHVYTKRVVLSNLASQKIMAVRPFCSHDSMVLLPSGSLVANDHNKAIKVRVHDDIHFMYGPSEPVYIHAGIVARLNRAVSKSPKDLKRISRATVKGGSTVYSVFIMGEDDRLIEGMVKQPVGEPVDATYVANMMNKHNVFGVTEYEERHDTYIDGYVFSYKWARLAEIAKARETFSKAWVKDFGCLNPGWVDTIFLGFGRKECVDVFVAIPKHNEAGAEFKLVHYDSIPNESGANAVHGQLNAAFQAKNLGDAMRGIVQLNKVLGYDAGDTIRCGRVVAGAISGLVVTGWLSIRNGGGDWEVAVTPLAGVNLLEQVGNEPLAEEHRCHVASREVGLNPDSQKIGGSE